MVRWVTFVHKINGIMIKIATAIFIAALFTTCRNVGRSSLVLDSDIWVAVEGVGGGDSSARAAGVTDSRPSLEFLSDGQLVGYTSCNSFFGSYTTPRGGSVARIDIAIEGITMALCPDHDREREYIDRLERVCSYTVCDRQLLLKDSTGTTILVFAPASSMHKK